MLDIRKDKAMTIDEMIKMLQEAKTKYGYAGDTKLAVIDHVSGELAEFYDSWTYGKKHLVLDVLSPSW